MYKDMEEFLNRELKKEAEEKLQEVQNDPKVKDLKAPEDIRERLFAEIDTREGKRTAEEEELIEMGRLYVRSRKRHKYFVLAAALVLALACGLTAVGGPKKIVERIRRIMIGRTQMEINVDSENITPIYGVDEEAAYQTVKDEWGVDVVRMQYYLEGVEFHDFQMNEIMQMAQFSYVKNGESKIVYQIMPSKGTSSQRVDVEETPHMEYTMEVQGQPLSVKGYEMEGRESYRWTVQFSYQELQYFMLIEDEPQSNLAKIVENLNFF